MIHKHPTFSPKLGIPTVWSGSGFGVLGIYCVALSDGERSPHKRLQEGHTQGQQADQAEHGTVEHLQGAGEEPRGTGLWVPMGVQDNSKVIG